MCSDKDIQPAAIISTGSMVLSEEYHGVASAIANRHLTVFALDYTSRTPEIESIKQANEKVRKQCRRCKCPKNGHHVTVSSLRTLARFASNYAATSNALVLGHSSGATVVTYDLFKKCSSDDPFTRHFCDGASDDDIRFYRPAVVALFDGMFPVSGLKPLKNTLIFNMLSQYASPKFSSNATRLFNNTALDVWFDPNVNHFGPCDYNARVNHVKTKCALVSDENALRFESTEIIQTQVIMAIADVVTEAYFKFVAAGDITVPSIALGTRNTRYVENVFFNV